MKNFLARHLPGFVLFIYAVAVTAGTFIGGIYAIAAITGAIICFISVWIIDGRVPRPTRDLSVLTCAALIVMALLNFHSVYPTTSWHEWETLCTFFLPLMLFSSSRIQVHAKHPKFFIWLPYIATAGALALGLELVSGGPLLQMFDGPGTSLTAYNRGLCYLVVVAFPILAGLVLRIRGSNKKAKFVDLQPIIAAAVFLLVLFFSTGLTESRSAKVALVVALAVMGLAFVLPAMTRWLLGVVPVVCLGWPFAAQWFFRTHYAWFTQFPGSWRARMEIWDYMSYRILEHPVLGWGLGTASKLDFYNPDGALYIFTTGPASHSHDAIVQLWVELGLPGLALG